MTMGIQDLEKIFKEQTDSGKGPYMEFDIIRGGATIRHKNLMNDFATVLPILQHLAHTATVDTIPQFTKGDE
jgi:hypothetical protein